MKLLVITSSSTVEGEPIILRRMFDAGLETLHVRKPKLSTEGLKKYLDQFPEDYHERMIIHTHHNLIWDYNLKGIHLTKSHKKQKAKIWLENKFYRLKRKNMIRSTSCSSISSLAESYKDYEYIMLSPIFAGAQEHRPTFSRSTLDIILAKYPKKIVARGGASLNSIEIAKEIGFTGIAFHNTLWQNEEPIKQFENLIKRYKELGLS